ERQACVWWGWSWPTAEIRMLKPTRIKNAYQLSTQSRSRQASGRYQPRESHAASQHDSLRASCSLQCQAHGGELDREPGGPTPRWTCDESARHAEFRGIRDPLESLGDVWP